MKVAAFCFAIISWIATAQGLYEYVFLDYYWQALMISFGVQSILFVFNLKLPEYFQLIGKRIPDSMREKRKYHFGKRKGALKKNFKWSVGQKIIAVFYIIVLFSSSFFSFVYIANLVYKDTQYIDANIVLDSAYQKYLSDTDEYVNEFIKITQIIISRKTSELQQMVTDDVDNKSQLDEELMEAQEIYDDKSAEENSVAKKLESAKNTYETPMNIRWRNKETYDREYKNYLDAIKELEEAEKETKSAFRALEKAKNDVQNYKPTIKATVHGLLTEILKEFPDPLILNKFMADLIEMVVLTDANDTTFSEIVTKTQELEIAINSYSILREIQSTDAKDSEDITGSIDYLKKTILKDAIIVPVPSSEEFDVQETEWETSWKERYTLLQRIIKSIPNYSKDVVDGINEINSIVNTHLLNEYDKQKITNHIDKIIRSNLAKINALERAFELLFSDFPFLAWFSLVFAIFLDVASLLAGLFVYYTPVSKKNKNPEDEKNGSSLVK